jgi:hypothetical protein
MSEENVEALRRSNRAFNDGELDRALEVWDPEAVYREQPGPVPQVLTITPFGCRKLETSCCSASAARGATCGSWPERLGVFVSGGGVVADDVQRIVRIRADRADVPVEDRRADTTTLRGCQP